ncbi:hypothetical protein CMI37_17365 [Candidatus Pacearchaeota archaeon]|nr:hypothetical protein [Candidatus Pacearchaeota archaeon]|tara:strand:+ start:765 stop:992 length:228 start_codon:yes stop_codon:yes gene_type:complete
MKQREINKILKENKDLFDALERYDETRELPFQRKKINLTLSVATINKLKKLRDETGQPISRIVDGCFEDKRVDGV